MLCRMCNTNGPSRWRRDGLCRLCCLELADDRADQSTMEEIEALIAENLPTMPQETPSAPKNPPPREFRFQMKLRNLKGGR